MSTLRFRTAFSAVSLLAIALPALSQTFRGALTGSVTDATGAVIAGAQVTAQNAATGLSRETVTTASGDFAFQDLPLGSYAVTLLSKTILNRCSLD
jgi:Carboxypeptidase regulatory-like domain